MVVDLIVINFCSFFESHTHADANLYLMTASCDAATSCGSDEFACNNFNGHKYWSVHTMTGNDCLTRCVDRRDLAYMQSVGYKCGACPTSKCDWVNKCDKGFNMFRMEGNGKCEHTFVKEKDVV